MHAFDEWRKGLGSQLVDGDTVAGLGIRKSSLERLEAKRVSRRASIVQDHSVFKMDALVRLVVRHDVAVAREDRRREVG